MEDFKNKPNFFIVGAAKCGTTTIYEYLREHPDIYMCDPKEPRYFAYPYEQFPHTCPDADYYDNSFVYTDEDYKGLFDGVKKEKVIGDGSIQYMYYENVAKDIKAFSADAKILIVLRNPVDRAFSAYGHCIRSNGEEMSFETGLAMEEDRIKKNYHFLWHYKKAGLYSQQVRRFYDQFDASQIKVVLFDEVKKDVRNVVRDIYKFLEVEDLPYDLDFKRANVSGRVKYKFIKEFMDHDNFIRRNFKWLIPRSRREKMKEKIKVSNLERIKMSDKTRTYLKDYFKKDVLELEAVLGKDLGAWK